MGRGGGGGGGRRGGCGLHHNTKDTSEEYRLHSKTFEAQEKRITLLSLRGILHVKQTVMHKHVPGSAEREYILPLGHSAYERKRPSSPTHSCT